jgi:hypothetical protein
LVFGLIKSIPIKYWAKLTTDEIYELQKISFVDYTGEVAYIPLNGELRIEYRRK